MNRRRHLLILLGATVAAPRAVLAQSKQAAVLIGWLNTGSRDTHRHLLDAFKEGLATLGWKDGSPIVFDERWAAGRMDRLPTLAGELVAKRPAVIVASTGSAAAAATKAAPGTPIVFIVGDPVGTGLVASLARPGGMVTGVANLTTSLSEKFLELLLSAAPKLRRIGVLMDTTSSNHALHVANVRRSVAQRSVEARYAEVARPEDIEPALLRLAQEGVQALLMPAGQVLLVGRRRIAKFALAQRWPAIGYQREYAEDGTLLSYGIDQSANFRRAAYYVDRILKGTKPGDLPVEQPTKFELVVNMKTAKVLGLTLPQPFLMRADQVIE